MAYQIVEFDGVTLPYYNPEQQDSAAIVDSALIDSVGGVTDYYGTLTRRARRYGIEVTGIYLGELTYLVDEAGNYIVDESGNYIIAGDGVSMLRAQVQALRAKTGVRGSLWRIRQDDDAREWITARLLSVTHDKRREEMGRLAKISCTFESTHTAWRAETQTATSGTVASGVLHTLTVPVGGDVTVQDALFYANCNSGTITSVHVYNATTGIDWTWTGSTTGRLYVNCENGTVRIWTTDSYAGFTLNSGHTAAGWMPLVPGLNWIRVVVTGAAATVAISHYNQWR